MSHATEKNSQIQPGTPGPSSISAVIQHQVITELVRNCQHRIGSIRTGGYDAALSEVRIERRKPAP